MNNKKIYLCILISLLSINSLIQPWNLENIFNSGSYVHAAAKKISARHVLLASRTGAFHEPSNVSAALGLDGSTVQLSSGSSNTDSSEDDSADDASGG